MIGLSNISVKALLLKAEIGILAVWEVEVEIKLIKKKRIREK